LLPEQQPDSALRGVNGLNVNGVWRVCGVPYLTRPVVFLDMIPEAKGQKGVTEATVKKQWLLLYYN